MGTPGFFKKLYCSNADSLSDYSVKEVQDWYYRLAVDIEKKFSFSGGSPLSSSFLKIYLGRATNHAFMAPNHLKNSQYVLKVLEEQRKWFLTETQFKGRWVGVIPRIQGKKGFGKWSLKSDLKLELSSLVEIPISVQTSGSKGDRDLLYSLRGFQLKSQVRLKGTQEGTSKYAKIEFLSWKCAVSDKYDFAYNECITVPNPDFGKKSRGKFKPVNASEKKIKLSHKAAERMEKSKMAKPFAVLIKAWDAPARFLKPSRIKMDKVLAP